MPRDTTIADRLRRAGLTVAEQPGWKTRGATNFNPKGVVLHHTAGPRKGNAPCLNICTNGRADLAGPLCHILIGRDGTCHVIAAGTANHAGAGKWKHLTGNPSVYGIEIENVGTPAEPWSPHLLDIAARAAAALGTPTELVCLHKEWAPNRKIDMHTVTGGEMRARIAAIRTAPKPPPAPLEEDEVIYLQATDANGAVVSISGEHYRHISPDAWKARQLFGATAKQSTVQEIMAWIAANKLVEITPSA